MTAQQITAARQLAEIATAFVAYEDGGPIYGVGATEDAARDDAADWTDDVDSLLIAACTPALAARVQASGGQVAYEVVGRAIGTPVACTEPEAFAAL